MREREEKNIQISDRNSQHVSKDAFCLLQSLQQYLEYGGTALRDGVRSRYAAHPKVKRVEIGLNPGETDLVLREF